MSTPTPILKFASIGLRIRKARVQAGFSQEAFAERVNTSRRHVMRLEKGQHCPSESMITRIAEVTETSVAELLGDDEDEESSMSFGDAMQTMLDKAVARGIQKALAELVSA